MLRKKLFKKSTDEISGGLAFASQHWERLCPRVDGSFRVSFPENFEFLGAKVCILNVLLVKNESSKSATYT